MYYLDRGELSERNNTYFRISTTRTGGVYYLGGDVITTAERNGYFYCSSHFGGVLFMEDNASFSLARTVAS